MHESGENCIFCQNVPTLTARPPSPLNAIGCPSKVVGTDAGVPGIFRRIAVISPPEMDPMYIPNKRAIPFTIPMLYVTGRASAIPIEEVIPGAAPKKIWRSPAIVTI